MSKPQEKDGMILIRCKKMRERVGKADVRCNTPIGFMSHGHLIFKCPTCGQESEVTIAI